MARIRHRGISSTEWTETEIEDKPLNILCHQGDVRVEVNPEDAIKIDPEMTVYHGRRVRKIDPVAKAWIEFILGYELEPIEPEDRHMSEAHVIGFIDLPIKLMQIHKTGLPFHIVEPESFLHPSQQARIGNYLSVITQHVQPDGSFTQLPVGEYS